MFGDTASPQKERRREWNSKLLLNLKASEQESSSVFFFTYKQATTIETETRSLPAQQSREKEKMVVLYTILSLDLFLSSLTLSSCVNGYSDHSSLHITYVRTYIDVADRIVEPTSQPASQPASC